MCNPGRFIRGKAGPARSSVDIDGKTAGPVGAGGEGIPRRHFDEVIDDRPGIDLGEDLPGVGVETIENVNDGLWRGCPHALGFREMGDEESLATDFF